MVKRKLICLCIIISLLITLNNINMKCSIAEEDEASKVQVHFITQEEPLENYEEIGTVTKQDYLEMWHYSGGCWKGVIGGEEIYLKDEEMKKKWADPEYLGQKIREEKKKLNFEVEIPQKVKQELNNLCDGEEIHVYIKGTTLKIKDIFQQNIQPTCEVKGDKIIIQNAYPKLNCKKDIYDDYVSGLNKTIPITEEAFGNNLYSVFKRSDDAHLGMAYATHSDEEGKIPYWGIENAKGYLKEGYKVDTTKNNTTRRNSSEVKIGIDTFKNAGAVGLLFTYPMELKFYKKPSGGGTVNVKHVTDMGAALGQYDYSKEMYKDKTYSINAQSINGYEFDGSMLAYDTVPTNKTIKSNYEITYDGSYKEANIVFIYKQTAGHTDEKSNMDAQPSAVIKADDRGDEKFDVELGIPTEEDLYANVFAKEYLSDYEFKQIKGTKELNVTATKTYELEWLESYEDTITITNPDGEKVEKTVTKWRSESDTETITKTYKIGRPYDYWIIDRLEVYKLKGATLKNTAFPSNDIISLETENYISPKVDVCHSDRLEDHIKEPELYLDLGTKTLNGGRRGRPTPSGDLRSEANAELGELTVKNDRLIFNNKTIMSDSQEIAKAEAPKEIPIAGTISNNVLYQNAITIDEKERNGEYQSEGTVHYQRIEEINPTNQEQYNQNIESINQVVVHAPVVCYAKIKDDKDYNQEINPDGDRNSLILGRASSIELPTTGQHREIKGYGERDYAKYTDYKEVRFPFDVYMDTTYREAGKYREANTWYEIPLDQTKVDIYIPIWVDEGDYEVEFREVSKNVNIGDKTLPLFNEEIDSYVATKDIPVRVIGRVYGMKITDVVDYPTWEKVFREGEKTAKHTGNYYWAGHNNQNGEHKRSNEAALLPLINGSHPTYKNQGAIKTGYKFRFELESVGNYFGTYDCIEIKPKFYFIKKDGTGERQEVDLWYMTWDKEKNKETMLKIGEERSHEKQYNQYIQLGDPYRNVTEKALKDTAQIMGVDLNVLKYTKSLIGWHDRLVLARWLRTFTGDTENLPSDVDKQRVKKSVQHWYGEYYLPNEVYACPKGFDVIEYARTHNGIDFKEDYWLKKGYIAVNFDIRTIKNKDFENPVLSYRDAPNCNMWKVEGYNTEKYGFDYKTFENTIKFTLIYGDIVFYRADERASDDYGVGGTH